MFTICGTLLAIVVVFIIVRYVRKSNAYQIALSKSRMRQKSLRK